MKTHSIDNIKYVKCFDNMLSKQTKYNLHRSSVIENLFEPFNNEEYSKYIQAQIPESGLYTTMRGTDNSWMNFSYLNKTFIEDGHSGIVFNVQNMLNNMTCANNSEGKLFAMSSSFTTLDSSEGLDPVFKIKLGYSYCDYYNYDSMRFAVILTKDERKAENLANIKNALDDDLLFFGEDMGDSYSNQRSVRDFVSAYLEYYGENNLKDIEPDCIYYKYYNSNRPPEFNNKFVTEEISTELESNTKYYIIFLIMAHKPSWATYTHFIFLDADVLRTGTVYTGDPTQWNDRFFTLDPDKKTDFLDNDRKIVKDKSGNTYTVDWNSAILGTAGKDKPWR